ncbi:hypothetical protein V6N11_028594 [Hibiscus sabdariffa]
MMSIGRRFGVELVATVVDKRENRSGDAPPDGVSGEAALVTPRGCTSVSSSVSNHDEKGIKTCGLRFPYCIRYQK